MTNRMRTGAAKTHRTWATANRCKRRRRPGCLLALALAAGIGFSPLLAPPPAGAQGNPYGCVGDCDQTGQVEINELLYCVYDALWGLSRCFGVCDANGDGVVTIDEVVLAVNYALDGCPPDR